MEAWQTLMRHVLHTGAPREDRTGVGTYALFGTSITVDNRTTFPAVTTKELKFDMVAAELSCFLRGLDNLEDFHALGCRIWDGNGTASYWKPREPGDLGRIYGVQWRDWQSLNRKGELVVVDQLDNLVQGILSNPHSRRHLVTAYNPGELEDMCLPPCHVMFQAFVAEQPNAARRRIDLLVTMRSVDLFLGLPFDIASYALLQRLLAQTCGMDPGFLTFSLGDTHIYRNHVDQVGEALRRTAFEAPYLKLDPAATVYDFHPSQASLVDYQHHPFIKAPLNV